MDVIRCSWVGENKPHYEKYHDEEWGVPVHDDNKHFEMLILEGAQAGLNWELILKKREGYRQAFHQLDPAKVAQMIDTDLETLRENRAIVRNKLKIYAARTNAKVFLEIQQEFGSFDTYVWPFVGGKPIIGHWQSIKEIPTNTPVSDALSKDLKKRGMTFVGTTIIYSYLQACGLVNDHTQNCWKAADWGTGSS